MLQEKIRKQITKDSYIDFAYKRYLDFKESALYDESYKIDILEKLNAYFQEHEISVDNVLEMAKVIQSSNPTAGSFVHWSNTDSLVQLATEHPTELTALWKDLYDESLSIENRVSQFHEKAKELKPKLALGAPLFGYLLAAYNYRIYPLYKGEIYQEVKTVYEIDEKMGSVSKNYVVYYEICQAVLTYLQEENAELSMLDIQDFLYCTNSYSKVRVEVAVDYLQDLAKTLASYRSDIPLMIKGIKHLEKDTLTQLHNKYKDEEKVKKIRYLVVDNLIKDNSLSLRELEQIKEDVSSLYDTNILHAWNDFTMLFHLFYYDKKDKVRRELGKIHQAIRHLDVFEGYDFVEGKKINGFNWNQSYGGSESWLAVYESKYASHRVASQLFFRVNEEEIRFGLFYGDNHEKHGEENTASMTEAKDFTYEQLEEKMNEIANIMANNDSESAVNEAKKHYVTEDIFDVEEWLAMVQDDSLFTENHLYVFTKLYEKAGESTIRDLEGLVATQFSSLNAMIDALAKRIYDHKGKDLPTKEDGEKVYWNLFFTGEYKSSDQLTWIMKENLKEAMKIYLQMLDSEETLAIYTKDDFLKEVFIEEDTYDTLANLLDYKRNIIIQGPPGVGKTFVSKRLAFSLMGKKDESRVEMVQFHQNYAYEDFVMGFRPVDGQGFALEYGVFYDFCEKALSNPEKEYYFIIDEINRGNLSKVFGELFMLIEKDKRDDFVTMGLSKKHFTVPSNVYLIGTMNTADRSLAQLDVALRRRFSFINLEPQFNEKWIKHLVSKSVSEKMINRITEAMDKINMEIADDFQLGKGFEIGHSFFTPLEEIKDEDLWFNQVLTYEIIPLLEEYYFDRLEKVQELLEAI